MLCTWLRSRGFCLARSYYYFGRKKRSKCNRRGKNKWFPDLHLFSFSFIKLLGFAGIYFISKKAKAYTCNKDHTRVWDIVISFKFWCLASGRRGYCFWGWQRQSCRWIIIKLSLSYRWCTLFFYVYHWFFVMHSSREVTLSLYVMASAMVQSRKLMIVLLTMLQNHTVRESFLKYLSQRLDMTKVRDNFYKMDAESIVTI